MTIRMTTLAPTSFDLWRQDVLSSTRQQLVVQQFALRSQSNTSAFDALADRLVGTVPGQTLLGEIQNLQATLQGLLSAQDASGAVVSVGESVEALRQSAAAAGQNTASLGQSLAAISQGVTTISQRAVNIDASLSSGGTVSRALEDVASAVRESDDGDPIPDEPATPNRTALAILASLEEPYGLLTRDPASKKDLEQQLQNWSQTAHAKDALKQLKTDRPNLPLAQRFAHIADKLTDNLDPGRRIRLGELIALQQDISHAYDDNATGSV